MARFIGHRVGPGKNRDLEEATAHDETGLLFRVVTFQLLAGTADVYISGVLLVCRAGNVHA